MMTFFYLRKPIVQRVKRSLQTRLCLDGLNRFPVFPSTFGKTGFSLGDGLPQIIIHNRHINLPRGAVQTVQARQSSLSGLVLNSFGQIGEALQTRFNL